MRLDRFLAEAAGLSRKEAKLALSKSQVTVNGKLCKSSDNKLLDTDVVALNGKVLEKQDEFLYLMLNKPVGVVSATEDAKERTVLDCLKDKLQIDTVGSTMEAGESGEAQGVETKLLLDFNIPMLQKRKIFPVGRLDKDTEGLLLLTDDGDLAHRLLSPRRHVDKKYFARVSGKVPVDAKQCFAQGLQVGQDYKALPAELVVLSYDEENDISELFITLQEGKFHQVKRMCHEIGCEVFYLKRLSMGSLQLDETLKPGEFRRLTLEELDKLKTEA